MLRGALDSCNALKFEDPTGMIVNCKLDTSVADERSFMLVSSIWHRRNRKYIDKPFVLEACALPYRSLMPDYTPKYIKCKDWGRQHHCR